MKNYLNPKYNSIQILFSTSVLFFFLITSGCKKEETPVDSTNPENSFEACTIMENSIKPECDSLLPDDFECSFENSYAWWETLKACKGNSYKFCLRLYFGPESNTTYTITYTVINGELQKRHFKRFQYNWNTHEESLAEEWIENPDNIMEHEIEPEISTLDDIYRIHRDVHLKLDTIDHNVFFGCKPNGIVHYASYDIISMQDDAHGYDVYGFTWLD